jgi:hypothetical protein
MNMEQVESWIRERAYAIWEAEGRPQGRELHHWEQAAREILASGTAQAPAKKSAPAKAAKPRGRKAA